MPAIVEMFKVYHVIPSLQIFLSVIQQSQWPLMQWEVELGPCTRQSMALNTKHYILLKNL